MARIDDYKESFRLASNDLKSADLDRIAGDAGCEIVRHDDGTARLSMSFLGKDLVVKIDEQVDVREGEGGSDLPLPEKILVCHYLLRAPASPLSGELITFRQVPDGHFYYDAFQRRARDPFLSTFGHSADLFRACAEVLGGRPVETGDVAMSFQVFPRIAVQLVLWQGDDEFPPDAGILFDSSIQRRLSAEDIAVMSGMLVYRLMGIARSMQSKS